MTDRATERHHRSRHAAARPIPAHDGVIDTDIEPRLEAWLDLLVKWNRTYNLTAIRDRAQMVTHHVRDALAILPHLPQADTLRILDIGTGAGVPGIPIAIARPDWRLVLLDSSQKKIAFVTQAVAELGLDNVVAVAARAEAWRPGGPFGVTAFDVVVSRAYSDLASFAKVATRYIATDGSIVAMKGAYPAGEIAALPPGVEVIGTPRLEVPGLDAERHLVVMRAVVPSRSEGSPCREAQRSPHDRDGCGFPMTSPSDARGR